MPALTHYLVVDLEATCWAGGERRSEAEIIEFGCVKLLRGGLQEDGEFQSFVRPERHPKLSEYCTRLTGIQQRDVDAAGNFSAVMPRLLEWIGEPTAVTFCAWGSYDRFLMQQSCRFYRLPYPFDPEFIDLRLEFRDRFAGRIVPMPQAMKMLGLESNGPKHSAINDARNAARIWRELLVG
ncbi:MAG: exonuclease domain-containing protein [Chlorobi bacterium]|nr:exonuclease domain-containing protein [Chlorobiota bacterium]